MNDPLWLYTRGYRHGTLTVGFYRREDLPGCVWWIPMYRLRIDEPVALACAVAGGGVAVLSSMFHGGSLCSDPYRSLDHVVREAETYADSHFRLRGIEA